MYLLLPCSLSGCKVWTKHRRIQKKNAADVNGTGPETCKDLIDLGYTLEGLYMVRFNLNRIKRINCNFYNEAIEKSLKHEKNVH